MVNKSENNVICGSSSGNIQVQRVIPSIIFYMALNHWENLSMCECLSVNTGEKAVFIQYKTEQASDCYYEE